MEKSYKPEGYNSVSVYLMTARAESVIEFLVATFNATPLRRMHRSDGSIMHAEVRIDDSIVMLADASKDFPPAPVWLHVYVGDVHSTYRRALAAGAKSIQEPVQKADEDCRGGVEDLSGNIWWIASRVP